MRKALVVGINQYSHLSALYGCVADAQAVTNVLERHSDGSRNFDVRKLPAAAGEMVSRVQLRNAIAQLFLGDNEVALLYFAGHGHIEESGGYICASDTMVGNDGIALSEILTLANRSHSRNKVVILDSCFSGAAGDHLLTPNTAELTQGLTILTAATAEQYATEQNGCGVFTGLFVDAMDGAAANLVGDVTPGSVYAHIDQSLGPWEQRPVFKTNIKAFISLRRVKPPIALTDLHKLIDFFPTPDDEFSLDPSYEPVRQGSEIEKSWPAPNTENVQKFKTLQRCERVNLVVPVNAEHMWNAAVENKACRLTVLGKHYHRLVSQRRL